MEQRDQQQKRDWGHRRVINKGHKYLSFPIQASFPSVMTAGVYHKTALDAALGWRRQQGETGYQMSAQDSASPFGHKTQYCHWEGKEWDSAPFILQCNRNHRPSCPRGRPMCTHKPFLPYAERSSGRSNGTLWGTLGRMATPNNLGGPSPFHISLLSEQQ